MDREIYFSPEKEGIKNKKNAIQFDRTHFGDTEQPIGTLELVYELNKWWDGTCITAELNPKDEILAEIGYHVIELGKNALEHGGGGEIKVIFENEKIIIIISDQGQGFTNAYHVDHELSSGRGLEQAYSFSDEFYLETNGRKYTKPTVGDNPIESDETGVESGTKITIVKNFE